MPANRLWIGLAMLHAAAAAPMADSLPLLFAPNRGQSHKDVRFMAKGRRLNAYFARREAVFQVSGATLHVEFIGATGQPRLETIGETTGEANFLVGPEESWQRGVPLFGGVAYRELYGGIDLLYRGSGPHLKSEFHVAPGKDPALIRMRYAGADQVSVENDGSLSIHLGSHLLRETAPLIYQERNGVRELVDGAFQVEGDLVSFSVGHFDRSLPLIIDPVIYYLTLLGGSGADAALAMAVDSSGAAYVAGFTSSYDFPTANPDQNFNGGGNDVFVAKLNVSGNGLVYCTYIGGRGDDRASGITVDGSGAAYITGSTTSSNFPVRNALQPKLAGARNAFVLKLAPAGNALVFSTYLGGHGSDAASAIGVDAGGNVYIAGDTTSVDFPTTGFQRSNRGGQDAFLSKLAADGSRLVYSTYLGGSNIEHIGALAVDGTGSALVTGSTYSFDFPVVNAYQAKIAGGQSAFVAKLAPNGLSLTFSTYLGGSGGMLGAPEEGRGIAVDPSGNVYVAGVTSSTDFPVRNAVQSTNAGWQDAFAAKFNSAGALLYSTYLGGVNVDIANAIAVDPGGNAYIAGQTTSANLASLLVSQNPPTGIFDVFVVKLLPGGNALSGLMYLGGAGQDNATAVVVDAAANVYLAGWTQSPNFATVNGFQTINGGNYSAFVGKVNFETTPVVSVSVAPAAATLYASQSQQFTATVTNASNTGVTWSISPAGVGSISVAGLYTAPATITAQQTVTVTATSVADSTRSVSATVTLSASLASNLALGKAATQSSTYPGYPASLAVDGNTDGVVPHGSVTVNSGAENNPWWQVDLGASASISSIVIWNRTDCCGSRLGDYWVFVSNTPFAATDTPATLQGRAGTWSSHQTTAPNPSTNIPAAAQGRYVRVQLTGHDFLSLAEVQVFGTTGAAGPTYSISGQVTISGTSTGVSGATISLTGSAIASTTTDASGNYSFSGLAGGGGYTLTPSCTGCTFTPASQSANNLSASQTLSFTATVSASPSNLALGKPATQSSTYPGYPASLAVDGNTDGVVPHGSVTVNSGAEANPWWQVDLGASASISSIVIWNRTDCCGYRLGDYWVFVSNTPFAATDTPATLQGRAGTWSSHQTTAPNPSTNIPAGTQGRYIRVQLTGHDFLSLAEVQVFGTAAP